MNKEKKNNWYTASEYAKKIGESRQTVYSRMNYGIYKLVICNGVRLIDETAKNDATKSNLYTFSSLAKKLGVKIPSITNRIIQGKYKMIEVNGTKLVEYKDCL